MSNYSGGQILRLTTALSALLRKPVRITRIRAGRQSGGGLKPQHLTGIRLLKEIARAKLDGAEISSTEVSLSPGDQLIAGKYACDTKTAGSVTLIVQNALPCLLFAGATESTLYLKGGKSFRFEFLALITIYVIFLAFDCVYHKLNESKQPLGKAKLSIKCEYQICTVVS